MGKDFLKIIKQKNYILILAILLLFFISAHASADVFCQPTEDLAVGMRPFFQSPLNYYGHTSQGMCVAGEYIIYTRYISDTSPTTYVVFDIASKQEVGHYEFNTLHSNSLTYNPDTGEVVCVTKNRAYIFSFISGVLEFKQEIVMPINFPKVAYVRAERMYYLATDTIIYATKDFHTFQRKFNVPKIAIDQGMGFDGTYLYIIWYRVGRSEIYLYDLKGSYHGKYTLYSNEYKEIEEVDFYRDTMFLGIANSKEKNGIYMVRSEHDWSDEQIEKEATCGQEGLKKCTCKRCGNVIEEVIPATELHVLSDWIVDEEPQCDKTGQRHKTCNVCKQIVVQEEIKAKGHAFNGWTLVKSPTVFEKGKLEKDCNICGYTAYLEIARSEKIIKIHVKEIKIQAGKTLNLDLLGVSLGSGDSIDSVRVENAKISCSGFKENETLGTLKALHRGSSHLFLHTKSGISNRVKVTVSWLPVLSDTIEIRNHIERNPQYNAHEDYGTIWLREGQERKVDAYPVPISANEGLCGLKYDTEDTDIFTIDQNGMIKGVKSGQGTLVIKSGFQKINVKVIITKGK